MSPAIFGAFQLANALLVAQDSLNIAAMMVIVFLIHFFAKLGVFYVSVNYMATVIEYLPDGFETTSLCLVGGVFNIGRLLAGYFQMKMYYAMGVKEGYYSRLGGPVLINLLLNILVILIGPLFLQGIV